MARKKRTKREKKGFAAYRKRYRKKRKELERRGESMRDEELSFYNWKIYHEEKKKELEEAGLEGANVNQYIVSEQAYERSQKQWRALKEHEEEILGNTGFDISKMSASKFRKGYYDEELNEALSNEYWYLKEGLGLSTSEAKREISMLFFGSK